jgi:GGDEF domain-containing protein
MISIQQSLTDLEKCHRLQTLAFDCYLGAINNMAEHAVDLDPVLTAPHRRNLCNLAAGLTDALPDVLAESRVTLQELLRDYHDRSAQYLADFRGQLSSTAQALCEMVNGLSRCDTDHGEKLRVALARLREAANSPEGSMLGGVVRGVADTIEQSLEQMRKQHQFTIAQLQTEMRLLHSRIDSLETKVSTDEVTRFSSRRFMAEYLGAVPAAGTGFLILKIGGLAEVRAKFGPAIADDVMATFGRRLRNTVPKDTVVGRWSEQDFLAIVPADKPADGTLVKGVVEHLSIPYACMIGGKVVRIPLAVTAECLSMAPDATAEQIQARVAEAFK